MTTVLLEPGAMVVDGVGLTSLADHSRVVAAGFHAESLYLGGVYGTNRAAIERAWQAGLPVMLNYERVASAAKGGYPAGKQAAEQAVVQAAALGFRGECPLPFSAADEHFTDLAGAGMDYVRATVDVLTPIGWMGGQYGFREFLALVAQQPWWPDDWPLWHWGGDGSTIYPWTWIKQGPGGSYFDRTIGMQVDKNRLYKPMCFWSGDGPDEPTKDVPDMTPEEHQLLVDTLTAAKDAVRLLWDPDPGNKISSYFAIQELHQQLIASDAFVNRVATAIVAAAPGTSGLTPEQVADELARRLARDA